MASTTGSEGPIKPSKPPPGDPEAAAVPVKKIGKYEIQKKIGAGGMGAVYLALDPSLRRMCALKVLPLDKAKNPILVKRFKAEAQTAANLRHENIVTVFEAGDADGLSYIALEYVEGTDVARLVGQRGNVPLKRSIEIVRQIAKALQHAHEMGIVHRDIKPGNVLVRRDGVVKLADLGLARMLDDHTDTSITRAGTTVGTVDYMSPEQARDSKAADVRSDIYSLGCTWYFMLTGEPPFPHGSLTNKLRAHAETLIPDPRQENPKVSEAVFGVLRRMTEKNPGKRYQTPADLLADLDTTSLNSNIVSDTILSDMPTRTVETRGKRRKEAPAPANDDDDDYGWDEETDNSPAARTRAEADDEPEDDPAPFTRRPTRPGRASPNRHSSDDDQTSRSRPRSRPRPAAEDNAAQADDLEFDDSPRQRARPSPDDDDPSSPDAPAAHTRSKAKAEPASSGDVPAFKPPPGKDFVKPDVKSERKNAAIFYGVVGLLIAGSVYAIIQLAKKYGTEMDANGAQLTNTFGQPGAVDGGPRTGPDAPNMISGNAPQSVEGGPPAPPPSQTTVVASDSSGGTGPGGAAPGADVGPQLTRVTSEGGLVRTETTGAGTGGTPVTGTGDFSPEGFENSGGSEIPGAVGSTSGSGTPSGTTSASGSGTRGGVTSTGGSPSTGSSGTAVASRGTGGKSYTPSDSVTTSGSRSTGGTGSTGTSGSTGGASGAATGWGVGSRPMASPLAKRTTSEAAYLPAWVKPARTTDGLPRLVVKPGGSGKGQFATLNQAFSHLPEGGAVIQLVGNGPFPLYPIKVIDKTRIVIEPRDPSGPASVPLIVLLASNRETGTNYIEFSNTTLDFRNVHLALDASSAPPDSDDALLSAISSDVFLQNCSLSVKGTPKTPTTALKISGRVQRPGDKAGSKTRVLIENTLVRGNRLTGVAVNSEHVDLSLRNSLVWSGSAPAVRFGATGPAESDAGRNLLLVSTTLCSQHCGIQIAGDASQPVPCALSFVNSLLAAPEGETAPALFDMQNWSQNQQKAALGKSITWKSTDSLYMGWHSLIQLNPGAIASVTSQPQWLLAWKDNKAAPDKNQFQSASWPAQPIKDINTANFAALASQTVGKQFVKTSDGGWPGCLAASLYVLKLDAVDSQPGAIRLEIPQGMFGFTARSVLRVDAAKDDLGKFLEHQTLQNGTEIIVTGSGNVSSSPIVIEGVWVRLTFQPPADGSLVLSPRSAEAKQDGFITVINGGLEIVGGAFTMPSSERQPLPKWMIRVVDGDLAMSRCRVHGPLGGGTTRNKGLIQLHRSSGKPPVRLFDGVYEGYAAFSDCYLIGSGALIEADMHRRAVFFRNSIAVSRDDLLSLNIREKDPQIGGVVDLSYSTLSATDAFVHVHGAELGSPAESPLLFVADRCVFAPPLRSGQQRSSPKLLAYTGPVLEEKQLTWWENRCGHSADITHFLGADSEPAATTPQDFEKVWVGQWGASQVVEPLLGIKGVVLKGDLPTKLEDRLKLEPANFQLHASAKATTWDGSNQAIGAAIAKMNPPLLRAIGSTASPKTKTPPKKAPQGTPGVTF